MVAAALTETGNIGIVSAFPSVQVIRRQNGFILGVQDAAELLGKESGLLVCSGSMANLVALLYDGGQHDEALARGEELAAAVVDFWSSMQLLCSVASLLFTSLLVLALMSVLLRLASGMSSRSPPSRKTRSNISASRSAVAAS